MSTFANKSIYHSYLVNHDGELIVKFGKPIESKYKKGTLTAAMDVRGDDQTYFLAIENDAIAADIEKHHGRWVSIEAGGQKDGAFIKFSPASGGSFDTYAPESILDQYVSVLECVESVFGEAYSEDGLPKPAAHDVATTLWIQWSRTNFSVPLYADQVPREAEDRGEDVRELTEAVEAYIRGEDAIEWSGTSHDGKDLESMLAAINGVLDDNPGVDRLGGLLKWLAAESIHQATSQDDELPF